MNRLKLCVLTFGTALAGLAAGAASAAPVALTNEEVETTTDLLNTLEDWRHLSLERVNVTWAGAARGDEGVTKVQLTRCDYTGCQPWKDIYIKRDAGGIIADRPVEFVTTIEAASSNPFVHSRPEFLEAMNVLFQNPAVLAAASRVGNTVFTGVYDRIDEGRLKFTFVLGRTGPWLANRESAGLVITRENEQNIHYWTFGKTAD